MSTDIKSEMLHSAYVISFPRKVKKYHVDCSCLFFVSLTCVDIVLNESVGCFFFFIPSFYLGGLLMPRFFSSVGIQIVRAVCLGIVFHLHVGCKL